MKSCFHADLVVSRSIWADSFVAIRESVGSGFLT